MMDLAGALLVLADGLAPTDARDKAAKVVHATLLLLSTDGDVRQEIMCRLLDRRAQFIGTGSAEGFLRRIAENIRLDGERKRARERVGSEQLARSAAESTTVDANEARINVAALARRVDELIDQDPNPGACVEAIRSGLSHKSQEISSREHAVVTAKNRFDARARMLRRLDTLDDIDRAIMTILQSVQRTSRTK